MAGGDNQCIIMQMQVKGKLVQFFSIHSNHEIPFQKLGICTVLVYLLLKQR